MLSTVEIARANQANGIRTFAAQPLNLRNKGDRRRLDSVLTHGRLVGEPAWNHFKNLGEVHFALTRAARIAGYAKIFPVTFAPDGTVEDVIESGPASDIVASVYSRAGGTRGLLERYFLQQKIPAESHLIRVMNGDQQDGYMFLSSRELDSPSAGTGLDIERATQSGAKLTWRTMPHLRHSTGQGDWDIPISQANYLGRVWSPAPDYFNVPESPLMALDTLCTLLTDMGKFMSAAFKSRLFIAGMLFFPQSMQQVLGGRNDSKGGQTDFLDVMWAIIKENALADGEATSIAPMLMMGEDDAGEKIKHITVDRVIAETDLKLRAELIDRILFGLDIVSQATTSGEDVNHFGAWQAAADELRLAVIPDVEAFCWTIDRLILKPELAKLSPTITGDISRVGIYYDLSSASVRANRQADAKTLRDQGILNAMANLKAGGWTEEDQLAGAEYIRWLGIHVKDPYLASFGMPEQDDIDWDKVKSTMPTGRPAEGTDDLPAGPGVGDPGSPDDEDTDRPEDSKPV